MTQLFNSETLKYKYELGYCEPVCDCIICGKKTSKYALYDWVDENRPSYIFLAEVAKDATRSYYTLISCLISYEHFDKKLCQYCLMALTNKMIKSKPKTKQDLDIVIADVLKDRLTKELKK